MWKRSATLLMLASCAGALSPVLAEEVQGAPADTEPPGAAAPSSAAESGAWQPPDPSAVAFDWIRLKSGEWLKGEIVRMRDDEIKFDSDELDEIDYDWGDVTAFFSPRLHTYVFEGRRIYTGTATLRDGRIVVATADGPREFERSGLVAIVPGDQSERNWWSGKMSMGLIARAGNTDTTDFVSQFNVTREAPVARLGLAYNGAISMQGGEETTNNHRANLALDFYVSRRLFLTLPSVAFYQDKFQNIDQQITPGAGLGYDLIKTKRLDWQIVLGAAYQYTEFISVSEGPRTRQDAAVLASSAFELEVSSDVDFDTEYRIQVVATNPGLTTQHLLSTLSVDIWGPIDLDVSFTWDRVERPVTDSSGVTPESDDFRLSVGLGIEF